MESYLPELTFISVFSCLLCVYLAWESDRKQSRIRKRLKIGARQGALPTGRAEILTLLRRLWKYLAPKKEGEISRIRRDLIHAGFRDSAAIYYYAGFRALASLLSVMSALLYFFLADAMVPLHVAMAAVLVVLGGNLPRWLLQRRVKKRQQTIFKELPDTLDMLVVCIEAGLGFEMALYRVSRELSGMAPVLSKEFALYFFETRGGLSRRQALTHLKDRNGSDALRGVVDVILQSVRFGTDIAVALSVHAESMRTKRQQLAEEKAAKIAPKLVLPLIGLILPALLIIVLGPAVVNLSRHFLE